MSADIPLSVLKKEQFYEDDRKSSDLIRGLDANLYPVPKAIKRKLALNLLFEVLTAALIYYHYERLLSVHRLFAPAVLGASTAAIAQSFNQFYKNKLNYNKIFKFITWGLINGSFTNLWLDILVSRVDSVVYRIVLDQLIGAPSFQLTFTILNTLWDNGEIAPSTRAIFVRSLRYSFCYWPVFSVLSFVFLPEQYLFQANLIANLFWSFILSVLL